jgi:beta-N-acetylhexosaminidase
MKKVFNWFVALLLLIESGLILITIFVDFSAEEEIPESSFLEVDPAWADTLMKYMSFEEKAGQLFFLELEKISTTRQQEIDSLIRQSCLGGIRFVKCNILDQLLLTNYCQAHSKYPLFIGSAGSIVNQEDFAFPLGWIINSVNDSALTRLYLDKFAEILESSGVHLDFSNTLEVNDTFTVSDGFSDSMNLVINNATKLRRKLYQRNLISCINYKDELLNHPVPSELDSLTKNLAHLNLSKYFAIQQQEEITRAIAAQGIPYHFAEFYSRYHGFKGIIFSTITDTLTSDGFERLFKSGTDIFIARNGHEKYIGYLRSLLEKNKITLEEIDTKVKKILLAKKWCGLDKPEFASAEISLAKIGSPEKKLLSWKFYEKSVYLIKNKENTIPFTRLINHGSHIFVYGSSKLQSFQDILNNFMDIGISYYQKDKDLKKQLSPYRNIILLVDSPLFAQPDSIFIESIKEISKSKKLILVNFGNPLNLKKLDFPQAILQTFDNHPLSQSIASQVIAGSISPNLNFAPTYSAFSEIPSYRNISRFQYTIPEAAGYVSLRLNSIDSLMEDVIAMGATPGCQILAAKNGKVFYHKSFGHHTYGKGQKVKNSDIYDIASITKVAATTMAAMKLFEKGAFGLSDSIKYYLDDTIQCKIKNHQLRDFFIHQSGLPSDMPVLQYIRYRKPGTGRYDSYYRDRRDTIYPIKVADQFYLRKDYLDSIRASLFNTDWDSTKTYRYSDINFNIIYEVLLKKIKGNYTDFLNSNIYRSLQLRTMGYLPLDRFHEKRIVPTQDDKHWRKQLLRGQVHDESAALYGGVAGNAGLFSNANDLAILFQMLLNGGYYGGQKVLEKEIIEYFTSQQEGSERGLGFSLKDGYFGHTGFTGCVVWANPKTQVIFVLLSNSIHPRPTNQRFKQMEIRSRVLEMIHAAYKPVKLEYKE